MKKIMVRNKPDAPTVMHI